AAFLLAPAIERFEVETDLVDRPARDREGVALFPRGAVVEFDPTLALRGDAGHHHPSAPARPLRGRGAPKRAAAARAAGPRTELLRRDDERRAPAAVSVVLRQEAV